MFEVSGSRLLSAKRLGGASLRLIGDMVLLILQTKTRQAKKAWLVMRCHSVGCGTASRTQSAMQSEAGKAFWKIKPPRIKTAKSKIVPCAA